jgi:tetratricopeptide (TPR) repeat protein
MFCRATDLDAKFASAYAMAAMAYFRRKSFGWFTDPQLDSAQCAPLARLAIRSGEDDAAALGHAGLALALVCGELDEGAASAERSIRLNANLASTHYASGWIKNWLGEPDAAIAHFAQAMRLSPLDLNLPLMQVGTAHAHFFAGRNDEASAWADTALAGQLNRIPALRIGAASHADAGRLDRAKPLAKRLHELSPDLRVYGLRGTIGPYRRPEHLAKYEDALRKAGLPG